jgi:hypothetical protein
MDMLIVSISNQPSSRPAIRPSSNQASGISYQHEVTTLMKLPPIMSLHDIELGQVWQQRRLAVQE